MGAGVPAQAIDLGSVSQSANGGEVKGNNNAGDNNNTASNAAKDGKQSSGCCGGNVNVGNSNSIGNFAGSLGGSNTASGVTGNLSQSANGGEVKDNNNAGNNNNSYNGSGLNINALNSNSIGNVAISKGGTNTYGIPSKPGKPNCGNKCGEYTKHPMKPVDGMSPGQIHNALASLNHEDLQTMKRSCTDILASRASYNTGTVQVCEIVTSLR
jgi:hypothetical protein